MILTRRNVNNNSWCMGIAVLAIICLTMACSKNNIHEINKSADTVRNKQVSPDGKTILYAEIVVHKFVDKRGRVTDIEEFYLRCSVQDYFIKFCECGISKNEILKYFQHNRLMNPITVEAEIRNGAWDICDDSDAQSRTGEYVVIKSIINK